MASGHRSIEHAVGAPRIRSQEVHSLESESVSSGFEFQKGERTRPHRLTAAAAVVPPLSKPARSKWDDAEKWIVSPTSNRGANKPGGRQANNAGLTGSGCQPTAAKVVLEVVDEAAANRVDRSQAKTQISGIENVNWAGEPCATLDSEVKLAVVVENPVADSAVNLSWHDSSSVQSATTLMTPNTTFRPVSMRDMGTEMTPIASQEPSRTGTPARATSPLCSRTSSQPSSPQKMAPVSTQTESGDCDEDFSNKELSRKELQNKTMREIMILGQQLGKTNIAAWASKKEDESDASTSTKTVLKGQPAKSIVEASAAWEEAKNTKYLASRFKREEIKIQAWENHQKATIEAEMRKIEVEIERMKALANEKLTNHLAAVRHKAQEKRATAGARRNQQAAKTARQAEYIGRTGQVPSSFCCWSWCS
ncbi:unnamed protein product [Musa acuminata subsp. burmannicoides]